MARDRDDKGRFTTEHSKEDILEEMAPGEPYTAPELSRETGIPTSTTYHYLHSLDDGAILKKKSSGTYLWIKKK